ncbi:M20/M25/M40 family metallo-hydrolase [Mycobacterium sp. TNTM28]|uniref:M20/M25/M40 family metallo-hydrolase n=1 Tax=[Mycobacterium] fortunisiensis TaxID=2600579 RepID=A0ABS6KNJ4_9MYCO|nr:M20/M25/M40 family metallo-hydrolase [[Mycobacterium] fortunisiensis]MBU9765079.1 M20/M25/M40 family metallo-hydrolase [[Mycobacterium] fortunisiensis]
MAEVDDGFTRDLLQELLWAYGPCGQEDAVRDVCGREVGPHAERTWTDAAGNLVARIGGADPEAPATRILAHLDELSMLVKRIEPDGRLRLTPLGTMYPANFGLGLVAILGDDETICGVLALGSEHTTQETPHVWRTKPDQGDKALDWPDVHVFTGLDPEQLAKSGIGPGTRVCIDRSKRDLIEIGDYLGCYFMDDRAAVLTLLLLARRLTATGRRPAGDLHLVFTTNEEVGGVGAAYACRTLPGDLTLAVEVGPTEAEYGTTVTGGPIVAYSDAQCVYDKGVADRLCDVARNLGYAPQAAVLGAFESDASHAKAAGLSPQAGLLCLPTLSTHGYEVIARSAITAVTDVLVDFVVQI